MRLSDAGLHRRQTKVLYPNHRLPPWLTEDATRDRSNRLLGAALSHMYPTNSREIDPPIRISNRREYHAVATFREIIIWNCPEHGKFSGILERVPTVPCSHDSAFWRTIEFPFQHQIIHSIVKFFATGAPSA
jgi:hypothetical protein